MKTAKELSDLVVKEKFIVQDIISETIPTSFTPVLVLGGPSAHHKTGYVCNTQISVLPIDTHCPVYLLIFKGYTSVSPGDEIEALIPRFVAVDNHSILDRNYYMDREYQSTEDVIEIIKTSGQNRRIERAADYYDYIKQIQ